MTKRILAILAAICLLAAVGSVGASAIEFNEDKTAFQILVLPDMHQTEEEDLNLIEYIKSAISYMRDVNKSPLDLVIFLGDNTTGAACASTEALQLAIKRILAPIQEAEVPFTLVFGNHDYGDMPDALKGSLGKAGLLELYKAADEKGLFVEPTATLAPSATSGATNFYYEITKKGEAIVPEGEVEEGQEEEFEAVPYAQLFLFDTGSKDAGQGGYDYVRAEQMEFFEANNNKDIPAYVFQHIPLPEVYSGGYFLKSPFNWALPLTENYIGTNYYGTPNFIKMVGTVLESPCPPNFADEAKPEFATLRKPGNVQAVFFGHDHVNNYVETIDGMDLVQLPGTAWNGSYGTFLVRGGTIVSIRTNKTNGQTYYANDFYTYRQAASVSGSGVASTMKGFNDFIYVVPFALQNMFAPLRTLFGNW